MEQPAYFRNSISEAPRAAKIAVFADDLMYFIPKPHVSIHNLMLELLEYQQLSNFKVTQSKSSALNVMLPQMYVD